MLVCYFVCLCLCDICHISCSTCWIYVGQFKREQFFPSNDLFRRNGNIFATECLWMLMDHYLFTIFNHTLFGRYSIYLWYFCWNCCLVCIFVSTMCYVCLSCISMNLRLCTSLVHLLHFRFRSLPFHSVQYCDLSFLNSLNHQMQMRISNSIHAAYNTQSIIIFLYWVAFSSISKWWIRITHYCSHTYNLSVIFRLFVYLRLQTQIFEILANQICSTPNIIAGWYIIVCIQSASAEESIC